jgi:hypothetical protein
MINEICALDTVTFVTPALFPVWDKRCRSEVLIAYLQNWHLKTTDTEILSEEAIE